MSRYTTELRNIIDSPQFDIILEALTEYPIFDDSYRDTLNQKILDHYRFHEIGFETGERFIFELNTTMKEIMPYYNEIYKSTLLEINPLLTFQSTETKTKVIDSDTTKVTDHDGSVGTVEKTTTDSDLITSLNDDSKTVSSDTPQNLLLSGDISGDTYATQVDVRDNNTSGSERLDITKDNTKTDTVKNDTTLTSATDETETTSITTEGFEETSQSELLIKYRKSIINVDMMVIARLRKLFMLIYGEL